MIQPIKMKPQNTTSFFGLKKSINDPLDSRSAYSKVLEDNKQTLKNESLKFEMGARPQNNTKLDFKG